ncbi:MAG: NAD(P)/FAD-dependent oxidoreductase [Puniceicoccaceae bacterium]
MPEFENILVTGGGLAGISAAYWAAGQGQEGNVVLLERSTSLLSGFQSLPSSGIPVATRSGSEGPDCLRGGTAGERLLSAWPGSATYDWLQSIGLPLATTDEGTLLLTDLPGFREACSALLDSRGVRVLTEYPLETVSAQPGGGFRVWSRDGMALTGKSLLLATGGERNHGMKLARELGLEVNPGLPAFVRLRLTGTKLAERLGSLQKEVHLHCEKTGLEASGAVTLSPRGLEGPGLSALSAQAGKVWEQLGWNVRLRIDWNPHLSGSAIRNELQSRVQSGGRRQIGSTPLFGLNGKQWNTFLHASRINPEDPWPRIKARRLQGLVQLLKGQSLAFKGMGLPAGERAWAGGVDLQCLDAECQSLACPGLYFAGEIIDLLGYPGGSHVNLAWASAHVSGNAIGQSQG